MPKKERCSGKVRAYGKADGPPQHRRNRRHVIFRLFFHAPDRCIRSRKNSALFLGRKLFLSFPQDGGAYSRSMTSRNRSSDAHPRQFITIAFERSLCRTIDAHYRFVIDKCVISCYTDNQLRFSESNPNTGDIIQWTLSGDVLRSALSLPFSACGRFCA